MVRDVINDLMQNHRFWLFDIVPSATLPFFVLGSPVYAFSAITVPEYTFDTREIKQGNSMFKRTVYEGGGLGTITLSRGARVYDNSFYQWVKHVIDGTDSIDRTLMLVHYCGAGLSGIEGVQAAGKGLNELGNVVQNPLRAAVGRFQDMDRNYALNVPGRAWILWGCCPTRYRPGSDFDATDASVSIMELEISVYAMNEFVLMAPVF